MQSRNVDRSGAEPLPAAVRAAAQRVTGALPGWACDQVTVNDYPPGVGLNPHIDTHSAFAGAHPPRPDLLPVLMVVPLCVGLRQLRPTPTASQSWCMQPPCSALPCPLQRQVLPAHTARPSHQRHPRPSLKPVRGGVQAQSAR